MKLLLEESRGRLLRILHHIDSTHAISAIEKGYAKKLRHLSMTQRVGIGLLNECAIYVELQLENTYCPAADMDGDLFTPARKGANARAGERQGPATA